MIIIINVHQTCETGSPSGSPRVVYNKMKGFPYLIGVRVYPTFLCGQSPRVLKKNLVLIPQRGRCHGDPNT